MCLVAVYLQQPEGSPGDEPVLTDVARVETSDSEVLLHELFGQLHTIKGTLRSVDLVNNSVIIETCEEGLRRAD